MRIFKKDEKESINILDLGKSPKKIEKSKTVCFDIKIKYQFEGEEKWYKKTIPFSYTDDEDSFIIGNRMELEVRMALYAPSIAGNLKYEYKTPSSIVIGHICNK